MTVTSEAPETTTLPALRVLVADDHPVFLAGLSMVLSAADGITVVGEAQTGRVAVDLARRERPDVVVMDVDLPLVNGISATQIIRSEMPGTAVLMLTVLDDLDTVLGALRAGARGYLLKRASLDDVSRALRAVSRGAVVFCSEISRQVVEHITRPADPGAVPFPELTWRERDVLRLVAEGKANGVIARELNLSIKTVRNYVSRIFAKLHVAHRTEAAIRARKEGLGV